MKVILIVVLLLLFVSGCSMSFQEKYPKFYQKYQSFKRNKALALAEDPNGAYGYGYWFSTIEGAKHRAMIQCKLKKMKFNVRSKCKIYFINDKPLDK